MRPFQRFIGIDLGGARGKTTAVASGHRDEGLIMVDAVDARHGSSPWTDDALITFIDSFDSSTTLIAIDAPLTAPACVRCTLEKCPGSNLCSVPAVRWLNDREQHAVHVAFRESDVAIANRGSLSPRGSPSSPPARAPVLAPYTHRCTEVVLHFDRGVYPREHLGQGLGPLAARAGHLRRLLAARGYALHQNLIEVSPRATVHALFGEWIARGYKRDADPWLTRASIIEGLSEALRFSPRSRLAREDVLQNDHCFDALLTAYTAFLFARDEWTLPQDPTFATDGWIWAPPATA